ncbi:hypothetical protein [Streptomyces sp. NBC_00063]|uniref:hypothetical protein n=1 Tax=Streptomyces sp. NBC_00063 TaxID=2975638 RepID=UPI003D72B063
MNAQDKASRPGAYYQHLAEEFTARVQALQEAGEIIDPRAPQFERLKKQNAELTNRVARRDAEVAKLTEFRTLTVSRVAAQYDEIERLRSLLTQQAEAGDVVAPPASAPTRRGGRAVRVLQLTQAATPSSLRVRCTKSRTAGSRRQGARAALNSRT